MLEEKKVGLDLEWKIMNIQMRRSSIADSKSNWCLLHWCRYNWPRLMLNQRDKWAIVLKKNW